MKDFFSSRDYKNLVREWVQSRPSGGHGQYRQIASALDVSTVLISQIFNGDREITLDQAWVLTEFMGLSSLQAEYFHLLVQWSRAGRPSLKKHLESKLQQIRSRAQNLKERLPQNIQMNEAEKALFYSNWYYSAIRLLTSLPDCKTVDAIASRLELPRSKVAEVVEFLLAKGLCVEQDGELDMGPNRTHLEKTSPYVRMRQIDWRMRGFDAMNADEPIHLFFTAPLTVDRKGLENIRLEILKLIDAVSDTVRDASPEDLVCLNIDLFRVVS